MEREGVGGSDSAEDKERKNVAKAADKIIRAMSGSLQTTAKYKLDFYIQTSQMSPLRFRQLIHSLAQICFFMRIRWLKSRFDALNCR